MLLRSLEIFGFKSFAERTKFVFDQGITGIVGPNGCGKSNIVDAIRWVLGEQKTKNLRSDKMENVIFNGTSGKRKSHLAEVSLTFENTKNILPTEYSTVSITRKLYRSGDSEYLINGVSCRLKDIQNLFMDTGIGSDSYAIIELKMVDEILTNKDNERRKFFEEAAGISKYKTRKKQTIKRLQDTDADLERVEDLLFEIEKNLKALERQARRTQKYFELKEEYKLISSQFAYLLSINIKERQQQVSFLQQNLSDKFSQAQSSYAQQEARLQDLKKQWLDQEKQLSAAQAEMNQHLKHIQEVETQKSIKNERLKYLQQREMAIQNQLVADRERLEELESALKESQKQMDQVKVNLEEQQVQVNQLQQDLNIQHERLEAQSAETSHALSNYRELEQEIQALTRELDVIQVQWESLNRELERTREDQSQRHEDLDSFASKTQELQETVGTLKSEVDQIQQLKSQQAEAIEKTGQEIAQLKDQIYKTNRVLDARQNEYNLTRDLVENLEGFPESVKFLKKNARWIREAPLVSDILNCPEKYKVALENYLESFLSYYVVRTRKDAVLSVHMLADASKGRANFFILEELEHYKTRNPLLFTQAKAALDIVEVEDRFKKLASYLLDRVYFVPHESDLPEDIPDDLVFLTHSGNIARKKFVVSGGSLGLFEGKRLGRAGNLEKLEKEIEKLEQQLIQQKDELDQLTSRLEKLKQPKYQQQLSQTQSQLNEKERDLSVIQSRENEYRNFLERVGKRSAELEAEQNHLIQKRETLQPELALKREELLRQATANEQQQALEQEIRQQVNNLSTRYNQERIQLVQLQNQHDNLHRDIQDKTLQIERIHKNHHQLKEEITQVRSDVEALASSNSHDDETVLELYDQKKQKEQQTDLLEQKVALVKSSINQVESKLSSLRKEREHISQQQQELSEQTTEIRMEHHSLKERMSVEFQLNIDDLDREILFDKPLDQYDAIALEEKVQKLRHKTQNYGEINPMAIEAYNEMKERYDFMESQRQDLLNAKNSLLNTIQEIDETARQRFSETFTQVRDNFMKVFRTLFSENDTSDLILMNPDDPLESDISIIARPKGKRPLTISQLSGGEKTLTAVALLFSIYLIKPAPFCIFDEVDAPLDDANIDKFNNIIRDFSQESQFIIVTHNKRTMAATNVIYGVTMENMGVSRVIPVNLETLNLN